MLKYTLAQGLAFWGIDQSWPDDEETQEAVLQCCQLITAVRLSSPWAAKIMAELGMVAWHPDIIKETLTRNYISHYERVEEEKKFLGIFPLREVRPLGQTPVYGEYEEHKYLSESEFKADIVSEAMQLAKGERLVKCGTIFAIETFPEPKEKPKPLSFYTNTPLHVQAKSISNNLSQEPRKTVTSSSSQKPIRRRSQITSDSDASEPDKRSTGGLRKWRKGGNSKQ